MFRLIAAGRRCSRSRMDGGAVRLLAALLLAAPAVACRHVPPAPDGWEAPSSLRSDTADFAEARDQSQVLRAQMELLSPRATGRLLGQAGDPAETRGRLDRLRREYFVVRGRLVHDRHFGLDGEDLYNRLLGVGSTSPPR